VTTGSVICSLVKYPVSSFTLVGGTYAVKSTTAAVAGGAGEGTGYRALGLNANGSVDLGFFKPSIDVFAGYLLPATPVYGLKASGSISPLAGLTLSPAFKYTENLGKLVYKSNTISDGKYVSLGVTYTTTFAPVTFTATTTPKYDIGSSAFTLPLNELSAKVAIAPVTFIAMTTNADLLTNNPFTLYTEAAYAAAPVSVKAAAEWADVTEFATYTYVQLSGSVNVIARIDSCSRLQNETNTKRLQRKTYVRYDTKRKINRLLWNIDSRWNGNYTVINTDPTWNVKLSYSASF